MSAAPGWVNDGMNCCNKSLDFNESSQYIFSEWNCPLQLFWIKIYDNRYRIAQTLSMVIFLLIQFEDINLFQLLILHICCFLIVPKKTKSNVKILFHQFLDIFIHQDHILYTNYIDGQVTIHLILKWHASERIPFKHRDMKS